MPVYLLIAAVVIFACVLLTRVSGKLGIPTLLAFIALGMLFGSDGLFRIPFEDYAFAEQICSVALIVILFYGGFGTNWKEARPVAVKAAVLSSVGTVLTAALVGLFCRLALRIGWWESFLIGSVISSTDAASVFGILRSRRLGLREHTASLLEVESGSNDPFSYMLTAVCVAGLQGQGSGKQVLSLLFSQIVYGAVFGAVIAAAAVWLLRRITFRTGGFDTIFVVGVALLSYAVPAVVGGNGYLSAYLVGLVLGNTDIRSKRQLVHFFDGMTGLMQMLIFFLLGLLSFPSRLPAVALPALLVALFLTFAARPLSVGLVLTPFRCSLRQQGVVAWAGLRGAASIVFAIMATTAVNTQNDLFHMVFFIVLFSILVQGTLIPAVSRRLGMIDENADVLKTFNDYSEDIPVQFIRFTVPAGHPWCGLALRDITLPPDTLAVLLRRGNHRHAPHGSTVLQAGDMLVLSAGAADAEDVAELSEIRLSADSEWVGKTLSELPHTDRALVILIQRGDRTIIPRGNVRLREQDLLVIHHRAPETITLDV